MSRSSPFATTCKTGVAHPSYYVMFGSMLHHQQQRCQREQLLFCGIDNLRALLLAHLVVCLLVASPTAAQPGPPPPSFSRLVTPRWTLPDDDLSLEEISVYTALAIFGAFSLFFAVAGEPHAAGRGGAGKRAYACSSLPADAATCLPAFPSMHAWLMAAACTRAVQALSSRSSGRVLASSCTACGAGG